SEYLDGAAGVFVLREGQRRENVATVGQVNFALDLPGEDTPPPGISPPPHPERRLEPAARLAQIRNGMRAAAQPVYPAVFAQNLVVDGVKTRQVSQQVRSEPQKRLEPAQAAQRQFEVRRAPPALETVPCRRQTFHQRAALPRRTHGTRPVFVQDR